jgi:hypothetical protein
MRLLGSLLLGCTLQVNGTTPFGEPPVPRDRAVVEAFDGVRTDSTVDVEVEVADGPAAVVVLAPDGDHDSVKTEVVDGVLVVSSASGAYGSRSVQVRMPALARAGSTALGDIDIHGLRGPSLELRVEGSGNATVEGSVDRLLVTLAGMGDVRATGLSGTEVVFRSDGSGDGELGGRIVTLDATTSSMGDLDVQGLDATLVTVAADGSGDITLAGRSDRARVSVTSMGDVEGSKLTTASAEVRSTGSGDIDLTVTGTTTGELGSMGDLVLRGGGTHQVTTRGSGEVRER